MAYAESFIKLTFGGRLAEGEEIWSCGVHLDGIGVNVSEQTVNDITEAEWDDVVDAVKAYISAADTYVPSAVTLNWVKMAAIGTNGRYLGGPREWNDETGISGGASVAYIPQISYVVTLVADKFKDPGKYNRYYVPCGLPSGSGTYKMTGPIASQRANSAKTFINALNGVLSASNADLEVSVVSERVSSYLPVETVQVGTLYDTQRRRRNGLYEDYSKVTL